MKLRILSPIPFDFFCYNVPLYTCSVLYLAFIPLAHHTCLYKCWSTSTPKIIPNVNWTYSHTYIHPPAWLPVSGIYCYIFKYIHLQKNTHILSSIGAFAYPVLLKLTKIKYSNHCLWLMCFRYIMYFWSAGNYIYYGLVSLSLALLKSCTCGSSLFFAFYGFWFASFFFRWCCYSFNFYFANSTSSSASS